jgi:ABC-2 type transport system permease protein
MIRVYVVLLKAYWQLLMEYRAGMVIWILSNTLPLVMLAVWLSIAKEGPVGPYDAREFIRYYLVLLMVRQMTTVWVIWELDREIRLGELSPLLLRPINPIHQHVAFNLADKLFRFLILVPLIGLILAASGAWPTDAGPSRLLLFALSVLAAWALRFISQFSIGSLSFWITQSLSLNEMFYAGLLMLGGVIAPLDLFPAAVRQWAMYLPFRYMLSLPVEILLGRLKSPELYRCLVIQAGWLLIWFGIYRTLWKTGLKRYGAVGA